MTKIEKLKNKLSELESKLYNAQCEENRKMNNMGFGYGMRHTKINVSTRKSDKIKEHIKKVEQEIKILTEQLA